MRSKKADAINQIILLGLPSELSEKLVQVVQDHTFAVEVCDNCKGSGISIYTDRLCTKCKGTGEIRNG